MVPQQIHTSSQSKSLDRIVIRKFGLSGYELMRRAGEGAFGIFHHNWPQYQTIALLCGSGNNGGDGYVFAAAAVRSGIKVHVYRTSAPKSAESKRALDEYCAHGGEFNAVSGGIDFDQYDAFVDALFGIGLSRDIDGQLGEIIESVNMSGKPVMSLDIPSGLCSDTGSVRGCAVRSDITVTFISVKLGLLIGHAKDYVGALELDTLGIPPAAYDLVEAAATRVNEQELAGVVPQRKADAHKGSAGRVLIVGGNLTMQGAAMMAGRAAYRTGAGLVSIAMQTDSTAIFASSAPEIRVFDLNHAEQLLHLFNDADVVGIGPGLGQGELASELWDTAKENFPRLVVDADALNLLAKQPVKRQNWILTPHPGEAGRLLGVTTEEVQSNRFAAANEIVDQFGGVCVLKGAGTLIASASGIWLCDRGNPGMATGGMGDILTGTICALWAQGMTAEQVARTGVWLHASAGDDCSAECGEIGMIATDLLPGIRTNLNRLINRATSERAN